MRHAASGFVYNQNYFIIGVHGPFLLQTPRAIWFFSPFALSLPLFVLATPHALQF
jgi:hypothetical protein